MQILTKMLSQLLVIVLLTANFVGVSYGQTSGTLDGTVIDENGVLVQGALVTVVNENNGVPHTARTNAEGHYVIPFLEPGRYTITVTKLGYQDSAMGNFVIPLNKVTVTLPPIVLRSEQAPQVPATSTAVGLPTGNQRGTAVSNRTIIDVSDATNRGNYDSALLTSLPLSGIRTFDFFALLTPGVMPAPQTTGAAGPGLGPGVGTSGQFSVNGRRARSNNFTIDGSDNNDQDIGVRRQGFVSLVPQSIESVNEFQISTQTWDAELGRNIGAQVNAVSRSGGNEHHGTLYAFYNNEKLNARNFFDLTGGPSGRKDASNRGQIGFVLGGPIIKDRTHYFFSFERQNIDATQETHFAVPDPPNRIFNGAPFRSRVGSAILGILPLPNNPQGPYGVNNFTDVLRADADGTVLSAKVTQRFGANVFTGRYNYTSDDSIIPSVGNAINASIGSKTRTQNISLFLDTTLSATAFNQIRVSYGRTSLAFPEQAGSPLLFGESPSTLNLKKLSGELGVVPSSQVYFGQLSSPFGTFGPFGRTGPIGQLVVSPFSPIGIDPFTFPQGRTNNTFQFADTFVKSLGNHTLKFGADFRRTQLNSFLDRNFRPQLVFGGGLFLNPDTGPRLLLGSDSAVAGLVSQIFQTLAITPDSSIGLRFNEFNFFAQDNWKINRRFTVTYGLRYEYTSVPVEVDNRIEQTFNFNPPASNPLIPKSQAGSQLQPLFEGFFNDSLSALNTFLDGRDKIYRPDKNNFSPRVGLVIDPFGTSKTVIRLGYGLYYDQIIGSVTSQSRNVFPNFVPIVLDPKFTFDAAGRVLFVPGAFGDDSLSDVGLPFNIVQPNTLNTLGFGNDLLRYGLGEILLATGARNPDFNGGPRGGGLAFILPDANLRSPYSQHWNVSVQHQFGNDYVLTASYVGSTGTKLIRFRTPNGGPNSFTQIAINTALPNLFEPRPVSPQRDIPALGPFTVIESSASSIFHSLQFSIVRQLSKGLQFGSSYTYSHAIDEVSDVFDTAGSFSLPQNDNDLRSERADASFDVRHRSISYFNYDLPFFSGNKYLGGYQVAGVLTLQTGQPFTVNLAFDTNRDGNLTDRPSSANGIKQVDNGIERLDVPDLLPRNLIGLVAPTVGTDGALGRNSFRAAGIATFDMALIKRFAFTDRQNLTVRADFFNLFNRTHFAVPVRVIGAPNFGRSVSTALPARTIQFAVKYQF